jgi:hypothetical protein
MIGRVEIEEILGMAATLAVLLIAGFTVEGIEARTESVLPEVASYPAAAPLVLEVEPAERPCSCHELGIEDVRLTPGSLKAREAPEPPPTLPPIHERRWYSSLLPT